MALDFAPDPETYETDVVDPGTVAAGTAVGSGVSTGIGALIGLVAGGPWGAALGAGIGAGFGTPIGTAVGTSFGTERKEFPVGAGPQAVAGVGGGGGLNLDSFAWEKLFQSMDEEPEVEIAGVSGGLWDHTMFNQRTV